MTPFASHWPVLRFARAKDRRSRYRRGGRGERGKNRRKKMPAREASAAIAMRVSASTADFFAHQLNQRPAFIVTSAIGDKAVFSGLATTAPPTPATLRTSARRRRREPECGEWVRWVGPPLRAFATVRSAAPPCIWLQASSP